MSTPKVFISYSSKDRPSAETINKSLDAAGFSVWRDQTRLETDWSREIAFSLGDSDLLCLPAFAFNNPTRAELMKMPYPTKIVRQTLFRDMLFSAEEVLRILE